MYRVGACVSSRREAHDRRCTRFPLERRKEALDHRVVPARAPGHSCSQRLPARPALTDTAHCDRRCRGRSDAASSARAIAVRPRGQQDQQRGIGLGPGGRGGTPATRRTSSGPPTAVDTSGSADTPVMASYHGTPRLDPFAPPPASPRVGGVFGGGELFGPGEQLLMPQVQIARHPAHRPPHLVDLPHRFLLEFREYSTTRFIVHLPASTMEAMAVSIKSRPLQSVLRQHQWSRVHTHRGMHR